jgi:LCP family protein required for cell wall assembly
MQKKVLIGIFTVAIVLGIAALFTSFNSRPIPIKISSTINDVIYDKKIINPFGNLIDEQTEVIELPKSIFAQKEVFSVLLIGSDRRSKFEQGFNTDTMILVTVNTKTNKVVLTSVPRDLWINGNKLNALYTVSGPDTLVDAFEKVSGQEIDGYIVSDFSDFIWIIDSFGGVPIAVERTFTDNTFPNDADTAVETISFTQGTETMTGARALIFARSRKGDNGEGSDLMRAKRQHLILKGMLDAINNPTSKFWPMDMSTFFYAVSAVDKMKTTLSLDDAIYLWDFYKDKDLYSIESFVLDDTYIYHPGVYPESDYHAWVFIPRDATWSQLHQDMLQKLESSLSANQ